MKTNSMTKTKVKSLIFNQSQGTFSSPTTDNPKKKDK